MYAYAPLAGHQVPARLCVSPVWVADVRRPGSRSGQLASRPARDCPRNSVPDIDVVLWGAAPRAKRLDQINPGSRHNCRVYIYRLLVPEHVNGGRKNNNSIRINVAGLLWFAKP